MTVGPESSVAEALALADDLDGAAAQREQIGEADLAKALRYSATTLRELAERVERAEDETAELSKIFDLQWRAEQRAIDAWRAAHPGNDVRIPDRKGLVLWLLAEAERRKTADAPWDWRDMVGAISFCLICAVVGNILGTSIIIAFLRATSGHAA